MPTNSEYLNLIRMGGELAKNVGFLGIWFSGSTFWKTGDWAVLSDCKSYIESIAISEIYDQLKSIKFKGQIWISLDAPHSGKWLSQIRKDCKMYKDVLTNIMFDSCTDQHG